MRGVRRGGAERVPPQGGPHRRIRRGVREGRVGASVRGGVYGQPRRVLDAAGAVVYEGEDDREAEAAVVNALTDMPVPGQLINGVVLKKFKSCQKTFVMGKVKAEGSGLAPFKAALKSRKPAEVEEAQAILDSIAAAKKNLEKWIADDLAANDKGAALRDLMWFCKTWPSEKGKYEADYKRLLADPEAVKAAKALLAPPKKHR